MTPGRWQKEHEFENQVLALDLSLNPAGPFSAVSFRFPVCDGGQCYPGFRGVCENYKGSRQNGGLGTQLMLLPGWPSCPGWSQPTCPHLSILGLGEGDVDPPKQRSFPLLSESWAGSAGCSSSALRTLSLLHRVSISPWRSPSPPTGSPCPSPQNLHLPKGISISPMGSHCPSWGSLSLPHGPQNPKGVSISSMGSPSPHKEAPISFALLGSQKKNPREKKNLLKTQCHGGVNLR